MIVQRELASLVAATPTEMTLIAIEGGRFVVILSLVPCMRQISIDQRDAETHEGAPSGQHSAPESS